MLRVLAVHILLFLLPFAVYAGYIYFGQQRDPRQLDSWHDAPKFWLAVGGLILTIGALLAFGAFGRGASETFQRPEYESRMPQPREEPGVVPYINPDPPPENAE